MFLAFNKTVDVDFKEYDTDGAWPLMLDDFVVFMRQKKVLAPLFPSYALSNNKENLTATGFPSQPPSV